MPAACTMMMVLGGALLALLPSLTPRELQGENCLSLSTFSSLGLLPSCFCLTLWHSHSGAMFKMRRSDGWFYEKKHKKCKRLQ